MKMSLLICFISDPFHALMWKKLYERNFKNDIDELLVNINGVIPEVNNFIAGLFPEAKFIDKNYDTMNQGNGLNRLYKHSTGDLIMTMDSDNLVFKNSVINKFKGLIISGEYDVIGSSGQHCSPPENADKIKGKV